MGKGIDLAKALSSDKTGIEALETMKEQLIIVLIKRLGGLASVSVSEIDSTGNDNLMMILDPESKTFHFEVTTEV